MRRVWILAVLVAACGQPAVGKTPAKTDAGADVCGAIFPVDGWDQNPCFDNNYCTDESGHEQRRPWPLWVDWHEAFSARDPMGLLGDDAGAGGLQRPQRALHTHQRVHGRGRGRRLQLHSEACTGWHGVR